MITYEQIQKANEGLATIEMKDKPYVMVPQRVKAFRMLYPEGFITTDIISLEAGVVVMKTQVGYYDGERKVVLGTGMAYEKETNGFVNKTSFIENCETSSVGRALGFLALGIDGGGICSAEELVNAVNNQKREKGNSQGTINNKNKQVEKVNTPVIPATDNVSTTPVAPVPGKTNTTESVVDLVEIRKRLDTAIKAKTKEMNKQEKVRFVNEVIQPTLHGERNWKLCESPQLLNELLTVIEQKAA